MNIIFCALLCFCAAAAVAAVYAIISEKSGWQKSTGQKYSYIISVALPTLIMLIFSFVLNALKIEAIGAMPLIAVLFGAAAAAFLLNFQKAAPTFRHSRCIYAISKAALIVLLLEVTVFNCSAYFTAGLKIQSVITPSSCEESLDITKDGSKITVNENSETKIIFNNLSLDTEVIGLTFTGERRIAEVSVLIKDGNLSGSDVCAAKKYAYTNGTAYFTVHSKALSRLTLSMTNAGGAQLTAVSINPKIPLSANGFRIILLLILSAAVIIIKIYRLYAVKCDKNSFSQRLTAIIAAAFCMMIAASMFLVRSNGSFVRLDDNPISGKSPYLQMTDAAVKGRLSLDLEVDAKLEAAGDSAYDPSWRAANNVYTEWDRAYYNGKYYSYFGIAPLILFYLPIYLISGYVPPDSAACAFFAMLTVAASFLLIFTLANRAVKGANYLLTLLCGICLPFSGLTLFICGYGDFYTVPKLCGTFWLVLLMWLTLCAYHRPRRYIFLLCGICVSFIAASRPNLIIAALALAPFYIAVLINREHKLKFKLTSVCAFIMPIIFAAAVLMTYNYLRFGSPFEFGSKYQLTVNNIAYNNLSIGLLGAAIYHYFFQSVGFSASFPYIKANLVILDSYSRYSYMTAAFGVFALPSSWAYIAAPLTKRSGIKRPYKVFIITALISSLLLAWIDFAVAGLTISYVADIAPIISVCAFIILLSIEKAARNSLTHRYIFILAAVLLLLTILNVTLLFFSVDPMNIKSNYPELFNFFAKIFAF
ncbi:MAG: hypothetical protein ACI396_05460 [Acutalibacteraceae bacterium]